MARDRASKADHVRASGLISNLNVVKPATIATPLGRLADTIRTSPVMQARTAAMRSAFGAALQPNRTGLPDALKANVEAASGLSMDEVRVVRNSPKPAQLQALAYAQGTEIHLGPGQEQHLPHEAWHVVQQKQGRVKPTLQMKGVAINDDGGLEREADQMAAATGAAAALSRLGGVAARYRSVRRSKIETIQRKITKDDGKFYSDDELLNKLTEDKEDKEIVHQVLAIHADRNRLYGDKTLLAALELARFNLAARYPNPPPPKKQRLMASDMNVPARPVNFGYDRKTDNPMGASTTTAMVNVAENKENRTLLESAFVFDEKFGAAAASFHIGVKAGSGAKRTAGKAKSKAKKRSLGMKAFEVSRNHILADSVIYNILRECLDFLTQLMREEKMTLLQLRWRSLPVSTFFEALGAGADALAIFRNAVNNRVLGRAYKLELVTVQVLASLGRNNLRFGDAPTNTRILSGFDPDLKHGRWTAQTAAIYHAVHELRKFGLIGDNTAFAATSASSLDLGDEKAPIMTSSTITELSAGENRAPFHDPATFGEVARDAPVFRRSASAPPRSLTAEIERSLRIQAPRAAQDERADAKLAADRKEDASAQGDATTRSRKRKGE